MRIRTIGAAALIPAIGAAILGAGIAGAHQKTFPVNVIAFSGAAGPEIAGQQMIGGVVKSPRKRCSSNRSLRLVFVNGDGSRRVVDRGRTSHNGVFALSGEVTGSEAHALVRAPRIRFGPTNAKHRHICRSASDTFEVFVGGDN